MDRKDFAAWCRAATKKIRYGPDREMVSKELRDHLEDRYDALVAKGVSEEEAARQALEAMGSAESIAPQLAAIHRPWLGWIADAVKFAAIIAVIYAVIAIPPVLLAHATAALNGPLWVQSQEENLSITFPAETRQEVNGYQIQIDEVGASDRENALYFQVMVTWMPGMPSFDALDYFYAVDSNGNIYASRNARSQIYDRVSGKWLIRIGRSSSNSYFREALSLTEFDLSAQWVEIRYDRDGREIVLRVDLTGGANNERSKENS